MIFKSFLVYKPLKSCSSFYSVYLKECRIFIHSCLSHKRMSGDHKVEILCLLDSKTPKNLLPPWETFPVDIEPWEIYNTHQPEYVMSPSLFFFLRLQLFLQRRTLCVLQTVSKIKMFWSICYKAEHPTEGVLKQIWMYCGGGAEQRTRALENSISLRVYLLFFFYPHYRVQVNSGGEGKNKDCSCFHCQQACLALMFKV